MKVAQDTAAETGTPHRLSRMDRFGALAGLSAVLLTVVVFVCISPSVQHFKRISSDGFYKQAYLRLDTLLLGTFISSYLLIPLSRAWVRRLRGVWKDAYTYCALLMMCAFLSFFIVHFGRWQFGAWDFNILIEMGWRQILGQKPYVDLPATTPPGFNLGAKYAFQLFGVSWDANLYFAALFACATFLWLYWLMRIVSMSRLASASMAFAIECAAMLTLCFWWYNNSALIAAALFFLACLAYAQQPRSVGVQISYVGSLVMLSLMKPNIAGLTIICAVILLFLITDFKWRMLTLTLLSAALALAVLKLNHVPVPAMIRSYLSVADQRGTLSARFGYRQMDRFDRHSALLWISIMSVPLLGLIPKGIRQLMHLNWRALALTLLLPVSLMIAIYGVATNGEFRDVECTVLLAACGVLTFGLRWNGPLLSRIYIAIVCASIVGDLYYGATRTRVYGIGPHLFFEWQDNQHRVDSGFLKNMRVSGAMVTVEQQVEQAVKSSPGPYFFGPRLDFNYAALGLRSPEWFPLFWQPGTAFPASDQSRLFEEWHQHRFSTLIFLKVGFAGYGPDRSYSFYPQEFLDAIQKEYLPDQSFPDITVYHLREARH